MSVVKSDLVKELAENYPNFLRKDLIKLFDICIYEMLEALKRGERVELRDNFSIEPRIQKARVSSIKKIKTNTLNNVLNNSKYNNLEIDFLSIDIEGSEFLALKNFDFNKYNPKVIVVEHLDLSLPALEIKNLNINSAINSDIYKLIVSKNYTLVNMLHSDLVFVNNKFRD